ncbi:MAG TPA: hypothetical protein VND65_21385 [Candidatus Binatia bacterium]|nr:hypothetical protein [Candidatus Binatia bacterium]
MKSIERKRGERGYLLLAVALFLSLLTIAAAVAAPTIAFSIRREREQEMMHRAAQYRRAVRLYAKKTGRYAVKPEEFLQDPNLKYIRKLYKDPLTGGDFRLLHMGDVAPSSNVSLQAGASDPNSSMASLNFSQANTPATPSADSASSDSTSTAPPADSNTAASSIANAPKTAIASNSATTSQPGMVMFGVASRSKARTIREFEHKNHYNDWLFFYDPQHDRGYEFKGPTPLTMPPAPSLQQSAGSQPPGNQQNLFGQSPLQPQAQSAFQAQPPEAPPEGTIQAVPY